jgi:hypothetical protein
MSATLRPSEPASENPLWAKLSTDPLGDPSAPAFTARLARANGWRRDHAARVADEYRRFLFLAATAGITVTPSDPVDQAWHLHLADTHDYWERVCPELLGIRLHHRPSSGGEAERHRHFEQYAATLAAYEAAFGTPPPADVWPAARHMLSAPARWQRVDRARVFIIPKLPAAILAAGLLAGVLAFVT